MTISTVDAQKVEMISQESNERGCYVIMLHVLCAFHIFFFLHIFYKLDIKAKKVTISKYKSFRTCVEAHFNHPTFKAKAIC